jgi:hypothetical protein
VARYPFHSPPLEFTVSSAVGYTSYEPITRNSTDESLWIPEVLASINYGSGENYYIYAASCANEIREKWSTDWAFLIFVVDSLKDEDGMFADPPRFAYAYINGPFMVITYDNDDWGIDRMDLVVAHELERQTSIMERRRMVDIYTSRTAMAQDASWMVMLGHASLLGPRDR